MIYLIMKFENKIVRPRNLDFPFSFDIRFNTGKKSQHVFFAVLTLLAGVDKFNTKHYEKTIISTDILVWR